VQVHTQARVTLNLRSGLADRLAHVSRESMDRVYDSLRFSGKALADRIKTFSSVERDLLTSFRLTSRRVPGSSQSMLALRSCVWGFYDVMQTFTMNLIINPKDLTAHTIFSMAAPGGADGECLASFKYGHDKYGVPDPHQRPRQGDRYKIVSKNSVAASLYFSVVLDAFIKIFLGFEKGKSKQTNPRWCAAAHASCYTFCYTPCHAYWYVSVRAAASSDAYRATSSSSR